MSLDRTKALVARCINSYLVARLDGLTRSSNYDSPEQPGEMSHSASGPGKSPRFELSTSECPNAQSTERSMTIDELPSRDVSAESEKSGVLVKPLILPLTPTAARFRPNQYGIPTEIATQTIIPTVCAPPPRIVGRKSLPNDSLPIDQPSKSRCSKFIFRPVEDYLVTCLGHCDCLNASFLIAKPLQPARAVSEGTGFRARASKRYDSHDFESPMSEVNAKTFLPGDFAENGTWWTRRAPVESGRTQRTALSSTVESTTHGVSLKTPGIEWVEVEEWYHVILSAGKSWKQVLAEMNACDLFSEQIHSCTWAEDEREIDEDIAEASLHLQQTLLTLSESLLRRPGRPLKNPEDCRFLLLLLTNPLFYPPVSVLPQYTSSISTGRPLGQANDAGVKIPSASPRDASIASQKAPDYRSGSARTHSGIVKRILGLMSNLPNACHHYLICWFSRLSEAHFETIVDLVGCFVTQRLGRQHGRARSKTPDPIAGLTPDISGPNVSSSAQLHEALDVTRTSKDAGKATDGILYREDWQVKAAARVMSLLFSANNNSHFRNRHFIGDSQPDAMSVMLSPIARQRAHRHGQILPTSFFYNTVLDGSDVVSEFEVWESRQGKFSFCQYPMFLSIWAKMYIMEYYTRRQMEIKAREAFFGSILSRKAVSQYLILKIRRDCLVEDSLRGVSEAVGTGQEDFKKGLRIEFSCEEGVDAGGYEINCMALMQIYFNFSLDFGKNGFYSLFENSSTASMVGNSVRLADERD